MATFDRQIATAQRLIAKYGREVSLVTYSEAVQDPAMPWRSVGAAETAQSVRGVFLSYEQKHVDGTLVQAGDQKVYIPAAGLASPPALKGEVRAGAERWRIERVAPLAPNGRPILYELQVRR